MQAAGFLQCLYLAYASSPASERLLYRHIRRHRPRRIVEIGIGAARRADRLIRVALRSSGGRPVQYTGVDRFEDSPTPLCSVSLKEAYRRLWPLGARIRLVPGDPLSALAHTANSLPATDLMVIAADQDSRSLEQAWFYVPRMLHEGSIVLRERERPDASGTSAYRIVPAEEIAALAANAGSGMRRAA